MTKPGTKSCTDVDVHVGQRVRSARLLAGMSQERLGELLGVTFQQVQKCEKGINRISAGRLFEIAEVFNCEVGYFFEGLGRHGAGRPPLRQLSPEVAKVARDLDNLIEPERSRAFVVIGAVVGAYSPRRVAA